MNNRYKHNFELTDYPKIFSETYWGNFRLKETEEIWEVINNRNNFIEEYNIVLSTPSKPKGIPQYVSKHLDRNSITEETAGIKKGLLDHTEVYENDYQFILVNSPYRDNEEKFDDTSLLLQGWIKTYMLYHKDANSYIKTISKRKRNN